MQTKISNALLIVAISITSIILISFIFITIKSIYKFYKVEKLVNSNYNKSIATVTNIDTSFSKYHSPKFRIDYRFTFRKKSFTNNYSSTSNSIIDSNNRNLEIIFDSDDPNISIPTNAIPEHNTKSYSDFAAYIFGIAIIFTIDIFLYLILRKSP